MKPDLAAGRRDAARNYVEQGRLARTVGPDDGLEPPGQDLKVDIGDCPESTVVAGQLFGAQDRLAVDDWFGIDGRRSGAHASPPAALATGSTFWAVSRPESGVGGVAERRKRCLSVPQIPSGKKSTQ